MRIVSSFVRSAGVATSQGTAAILKSNKKQCLPALWKLNEAADVKQQAYSVFSPDEVKSDRERFFLLAKSALSDCLSDCLSGCLPDCLPDCLEEAAINNKKIPLIVASCNGSAGDFERQIWSESFFWKEELSQLNACLQTDFVVSGSCASGLQALILGCQMLQSGVPEVVVLSADILTNANLTNFRNLRILNENQYIPWNGSSEGFIPSEAAVALHICAKPENENTDVCIHHYSLFSDYSGTLFYENFLENKDTVPNVDFVIGQGVGSFGIDNDEISAVGKVFTTETPLTTPYYSFGHSIGSSGLLSVALGYMCLKEQKILPDLIMPQSRTAQGQKLLNADVDFSHNKVAVLCRALSGAGALLIVQKGAASAKITKGNAGHEKDFHAKKILREQLRGPLKNQNLKSSESVQGIIKKDNTVIMNSLLQKIFNQALLKKPEKMPDIIIVLMNSPIEPEPSVMYNNQLLPAGILEITPSYLPQLICRAWKFSGPSLALITDSPLEKVQEFIIMYTVYLSYCFVWVSGNGQNRDVKWVFTKK